MKAVKIVKAYACTTCGETVPMTRPGLLDPKKYRIWAKEYAAVHCKCPGCGDKSDRRMGFGQKCSLCAREETWDRVTTGVVEALKHYERESLNLNRRDPKLEKFIAAHVDKDRSKSGNTATKA